MTPSSSSPGWAQEGIPGTEPGPQLSAVWAHIVRLHALLPHPLLAIHSLLPAAQSCTDQCKGAEQLCCFVPSWAGHMSPAACICTGQ